MADAPQDNPTAPITEETIVEVLRTVFDPEIPVSIYDLGMIYNIQVEDSVVNVRMTLTTPACPVAGSLPGQVETRIKEIEGVNDATVELVWDPPWTPDKMSEAAKLQLNMDISSPPPKPPSFFNVNPPRPG
jgi:FeS assembly SUF system protein